MAAAGVSGGAGGAKKPTAKEMLEEEIRAGLAQTAKNLAEISPGSSGGTDSDDHGSALGVPPEVAEEQERHEAREREWETAQERDAEDAEEQAALYNASVPSKVAGDDINVEEIEDAFPVCPPPDKYTADEKKAWVETVEYVRRCRKEDRKVPIKLPTDLFVKWTEEQKPIWPVAKAEVYKLQARINAVRRRAEARAASRVVKRERTRHMEDPEAVAASGGRAKSTPSQPPFTANEKARLVHCVVCEEFRPCVEVMLRGLTDRLDIDNKVDRINPFEVPTRIFNNKDIVFDSFFENHAHGDEELRSLDPNDFRERPGSFIKGE